MKQVRQTPTGGLAITIAATKVDGIVLSLTPNSHSYNYRSAVLFGYGSLVEVCILSGRSLPCFRSFLGLGDLLGKLNILDNRLSCLIARRLTLWTKIDS